MKYKDGARYARDLAEALSLPRDELCFELGTYDCVDDVHRIVLGGVEPYLLGVRTPLRQAPITAPIAQDRVALAACARRVDLDLASADAVLLGGLTVGPGAPSADELEATAAVLYQRLLRRPATGAEVAALVAFYDEVAGEHGGPGADATRDWAALSCFAVATTLEALFY